MPRAGLSRARVVDEALSVADEVGFDRLSLAAIADRTGVRQPSLYKHIESLEGLRRDVAVRALQELGDALGSAVGERTAGDGLRAMAGAYRSYARAHSGRYAATVRAPLPGDEVHAAAAAAVLRVVNGVLTGYRLEGDDAVDAARTLRAALHGFVVLDAAGGFGLPRHVDRSFDRLVTALDAALSDWPSTAS